MADLNDSIYPLADDAGLILVERAGRSGSPPMRIVHWQNGQTRVVYEGRIENLAGPYGDNNSIGPGLSPFWLDNATYGYLPVQLPATPEEWIGPQEVVTAAARSGEAQVLVTIDDLAGAIPGAERPDELLMDGITPTPADPNRLFAAAGTLNFDLSADGHWLLRVNDGYFTLLAPAHDYRRLIFHNSVGCRHAFWANRP